MEEQIIRQTQAAYFKSAVSVLNGYLTMTNERILFSGTQLRAQVNHGAVGNIIRDKMEKAMGIDPQEELIFDIPLSEVTHGLKRFGLSKRLVISDRDGNEYRLMVNSKTERNEWPAAIDVAKRS